MWAFSLFLLSLIFPRVSPTAPLQWTTVSEAIPAYYNTQGARQLFFHDESTDSVLIFGSGSVPDIAIRFSFQNETFTTLSNITTSSSALRTQEKPFAVNNVLYWKDDAIISSYLSSLDTSTMFYNVSGGPKIPQTQCTTVRHDLPKIVFFVNVDDGDTGALDIARNAWFKLNISKPYLTLTEAPGCQFLATSQGEEVTSIGGAQTLGTLNSVFRTKVHLHVNSGVVFNITATDWENGPNLQAPRWRPGTTVLPGEKILVVGGRSDGSGNFQLKSTEWIDLVANTTTLLGSLTNGRQFPFVTIRHGVVWAFGGLAVNTVEKTTTTFSGAPTTNTNAPTNFPTSKNPTTLTTAPSTTPSKAPTKLPSTVPTRFPSIPPTTTPTNYPTTITVFPTASTVKPSSEPSRKPTQKPSRGSAMGVTNWIVIVVVFLVLVGLAVVLGCVVKRCLREEKQEIEEERRQSQAMINQRARESQLQTGRAGADTGADAQTRVASFDIDDDTL